MRHLLLVFMALLIFTSCFRIDEDGDKTGVVNFTDIAVSQFNIENPAGRTVSNSDWRHVFPEYGTIEIVEINTGRTYLLEYNPNEFEETYGIELPFGEYRFETVVDGGDFEDFLPFRAEGDFVLSGDRINVVIQASTDYGLITLKNEYVQSARLYDVEVDIPFATSEDELFYFKYVSEGKVPRMEVIEAFDGNSFNTEIHVQSRTHYHFYLRLPDDDQEGIDEGTINVVDLTMGDFEYHENYIEVGANVTRVWDNDGNVYRVVKIGNQFWMAENLRTTTYCNGEEIPHFPGGEEWMNRTEEAWTYYDNAERYNATLGKLYNKAVVSGDNNPCPCGWHVPTEVEWQEMIDYLGGPEVAGGKMKLPGLKFWNAENRGATNESGFAAMGAGYLWSMVEPVADHERGGPAFYGLRYEASWWSSTAYTYEHYVTGNQIDDIYRYNINNLGVYISRRGSGEGDLGRAHSIRCIMD